MFPLIKKTKEGREIERATNVYLEDYSKEGLRTLLLVEKVSIEMMLLNFAIDNDSEGV